MKRWILYLVIVVMLGTSRGIDISKLSPVETVWMAEKNGRVFICTDSGDFGLGENVAQALDALNASAEGIVFLETADYLIIEQGSEALLLQTGSVFRSSCGICIAEKMPDLNAATAFLRIHEPSVTLRQWDMENNRLPRLQEQDGRFCWLGG